jgi:plasmid stabilization system protein ParE
MQLRRSARAEQDLIEIWNFIAGGVHADHVEILRYLHMRRRTPEIL